MKFLLVTLFSVVAVAIAAPKSNTDLTASEEEFFTNFFENIGDDYDKYFKNFFKQLSGFICEKEDYDLQAPFDEAAKRAEEVYKKDHSSQTVCSFFEEDVLYVSEPLVKAIDSCVSKELTGVANYFITAFISAYHQICKFTGEEILELAHPCVSDIDFAENECFKKLDIDFDEKNPKPFKETVCGIYQKIRPCFEEGVKEKCKLPVTQNTLLAFFDSIVTKPCLP